MFKRIILIILISIKIFPNGQTPEADVPLSIKTKYDEEKSKFQKYDLDHPEKFLALMRRQLKKEQDPVAYLKNLRLFASKLLVQALLAQKNANANYAALYFSKLATQMDKTLEELGAKKVGGKFQIVPENDLQLEEVLAHSKILQEIEPYTPEQLQTIYQWIIDPSKEKFLNTFGQNRKIAHEGMLTKKLNERMESTVDEFNAPLLEAQFEYRGNDPLIIKTNTEYIFRIFENYYNYINQLKKFEERKKAEMVPWLLRNDFNNKNSAISDLYAATHEWYQKLYKIVYQELIDTLKEFNQKYPEQKSDFIINLRPLPETAVKAKTLPSLLPKELPAFIPPSQTITLPSLDKELEDARQKWQKEYEEGQKQVLKEVQETAILKKKTPAPKKIKAIEETATRITIHNPKNNTTEIIFKTDKPDQIKNLPSINYTPWVKMWFEDPQEALSKQGYTTFGNPKYEYPENRWRPIVYHAFSPLIDNYIKKWGTQSEIDSKRVKGKKDILITMPGIITNGPDKKLSQTGVYTYIIDSGNGQWYHRMFTPEDSKQLIEDITSKGYFSPEMTGYYEVFFPPLPGK